MPNASTFYFHHNALRQRFINAVEDAHRQQRIGVSERDQLVALGETTASAGDHPLRVDRLIASDASINEMEVSAALMISHDGGADSRVYLMTLAHGLERFATRLDLLAALRRRYAQRRDDVIFEAERVEGDPFLAQMRGVVQAQVQRLDQMTSSLRDMPSLRTALSYALNRQLPVALPGLHLDPDRHLVQIYLPASRGRGELVLMTQTLAQAAYDDYCNVQTIDGVGLRYLSADGATASDADAQAFTHALNTALSRLPSEMSAVLADHWHTPDKAGRTRREGIIACLRERYVHGFYQGVHEGVVPLDCQPALRLLTQSCDGYVAPDKGLKCSRLLVSVGNSMPCPVAGMFVAHPRSEVEHPMFCFSSDQRLRAFIDVVSLESFFATPEGQALLMPSLTIEDQPVLSQDGKLRITLEPLTRPVFAERVDSILNMQSRNLTHVAGLPTPSADEVPLRFDDALDIRQLLDARQLQFPTGRWRREPLGAFAQAWPAVPAQVSSASEEAKEADSEATRQDRTSELLGPLSPSWGEQSVAFEARAEVLRDLGNVLRESAEAQIQRYLCVQLAEPLLASQVNVQWSTPIALDEFVVQEDSDTPLATTVNTVDLPSLLLEHATGRRSGALEASTQVLRSDTGARVELDLDQIDYMLATASAGFMERYQQAFREFCQRPRRLPYRQITPADLAMGLREYALRMDLALAMRMGVLTEQAADLIDQALDRPERSLRIHRNQPVTEVYTVSLVLGHDHEDAPGARLADTLVLTQPADPEAGAILWCSLFGWRAFESIEALEAQVPASMHRRHRERFINLLNYRDRGRMRPFVHDPGEYPLRLRLDRVDGHALKGLQTLVLDNQMESLKITCERLARLHFDARLCTSLTTSIELDEPLMHLLDSLTLRLDASLFAAMMPDWLTKASIEDLRTYSEILYLFSLVNRDGRSFLYGIPSLHEYAKSRLIAQLNTDYPKLSWDPDAITVTLRHFVSPLPSLGSIPSQVPAATVEHTESLTDYAVNRLIDYQDGALSLSSSTLPEMAAVLSTDYVRALVRRLDIGAGFMSLIRSRLDPADQDYAERERLFIERSPLLLLAFAVQKKLDGTISDAALNLVWEVLTMPDSLARTAPDAGRAMIAPLQLVADHGMTPDRVIGMHVFYRQGTTGRVVLYASYDSAFGYREYPDLNALHEAIRTDTRLQKVLLQRLDPQVRRRYDHGGFIEPHLPFVAVGPGDVPWHTPGPVTVALVEEQGNVLQYLFNDTVKLLVEMNAYSVVTNAQADRANLGFLAALGLEQVLSFMPGKLGALLALWQSRGLLHASATSASGHKWGRAVTEFSAALGVMVAAREMAASDQLVDLEDPAGTDDEQPETAMHWTGINLTGEHRLRLQALEATDISLRDLYHDGLLNLFINRADDRKYVAVDGKVYQVRRRPEDAQWTIVGPDGQAGPVVILGEDQRWQLDVKLGLRGGGGALATLRSEIAEFDAEHGMVVEASGMSQIRLFYRDRAIAIGEAHLQAKRYLENCLDNLNVHKRGTPLDVRTSAILTEFYGVTPLPDVIVFETEQAIKSLYDAIMDASLSPFSSTRFVIGTNRPGNERTSAFVVVGDPLKRVYLTERFFDVPPYHLAPQANAQGFDVAAHYRAATLIHEVSHQALKTHDICYLETSAPYPDLLQPQSPGQERLQNKLTQVQREAFSHLTPKAKLFTVKLNGTRRDLTSNDGRGYKGVLRLTGSKTLDEARDVFIGDPLKRSRVLRANADSLTLLILRLGRFSFLDTDV